MSVKRGPSVKKNCHMYADLMRGCMWHRVVVILMAFITPIVGIVLLHCDNGLAIVGLALFVAGTVIGDIVIARYRRKKIGE